jgi:hypothetical protein
LDIEKLKNYVTYDKDTGEFDWVDGNATGRKNGKPGWLSSVDGYVHIRIDYKLYRAHHLAWLYVYGEMPDMIDHIDRDRSNNAIANLRLATKSENAINSKMNARNTSGFRGVRRKKGLNRWDARIQYKGKGIHLGYFDSPEDASEAYKKKARELFGEFAENAECKS